MHKIAKFSLYISLCVCGCMYMWVCVGVCACMYINLKMFLFVFLEILKDLLSRTLHVFPFEGFGWTAVCICM